MRTVLSDPPWGCKENIGKATRILMVNSGIFLGFAPVKLEYPTYGEESGV